MTCKEKLMKEYPDGWERMMKMVCPSELGYSSVDDDPCYSSADVDNNLCLECWDREISESVECSIKDSGERREFSTGAVRDIQKGKGRCDLLPLDVVSRYFKYSCELSESEYSVFDDINRFIETHDVEYLFEAIYNSSLFGDPYTMFLEVSKHFEDGANKYGEYNWQKGIPTHCYIDSAIRHYLKFLRGDKDEHHDRAFIWNILCRIWTCIHKSELDDYEDASRAMYNFSQTLYADDDEIN